MFYIIYATIIFTGKWLLQILIAGLAVTSRFAKEYSDTTFIVKLAYLNLLKYTFIMGIQIRPVLKVKS